MENEEEKLTFTIRVLLFGLEESGKTTLITSFLKGAFTPSPPSTGQKSFEFTIGNLTFDIIEVGGRKEVRGFVLQYIEHVDAIIFVIDGSNEEKFRYVQPEFEKILNHPLSPGKPLAVLFNKKDIAQVHPSIIIEKLDILNKLDRPHQVFSTTAKDPQQFKQVLTWIEDRLTEDEPQFRDRFTRLLILNILDMLNTSKKGHPVLSILGQLEIILRAGQGTFNRDHIMAILRKLWSDGEIEYFEPLQVYRITPKGREKMESSDLTEGGLREELRAMLDKYKDESMTESEKSARDEEVKDFLDDQDIEDIAKMFDESRGKKKD
ncbi:MAG: ADP-ribosylation factor-like protein [Promethearchaeota archaeon]